MSDLNRWHPPMVYPRQHHDQNLYEDLGREGDSMRQGRADARQSRLGQYQDSLRQAQLAEYQEALSQQVEDEFYEEQVEEIKRDLKTRSGAAIPKSELREIMRQRIQQVNERGDWGVEE